MPTAMFIESDIFSGSGCPVFCSTDVHPFLIVRHLWGDQEARIGRPHLRLSHPGGQIFELGLIVIASLAGAVEKQDDGILLFRFNPVGRSNRYLKLSLARRLTCSGQVRS